MCVYWISRSFQLPMTILKFYIEALTGFSHINHPDCLNTTSLSQECVLGTAPSVGMVGRIYIPRTGDA